MLRPLRTEKRRCPGWLARSLSIITTGALLLVPLALRAETHYRIQPIVQLGEPIGDAGIVPSNLLWVGGLNDEGQILFSVGDMSGGQLGHALIFFADNQYIPVMAHGQAAPTAYGVWPQTAWSDRPKSPNRLGNVAFVASSEVNSATRYELSIYLWDYAARAVSRVVERDTPAGSELVIHSPHLDFRGAPAINNFNEIAFQGQARDPAGKSTTGIFLLGRDRKVIPVALRSRPLPNGLLLGEPGFPAINDAGMVTFTGLREDRRTGAAFVSCYVWEKGEVRVVAEAGQDSPNGVKLAHALETRLNNKNRNVLLTASSKQNNQGDADSLYLWSEGQLIPVLQPGQRLPGGGQFRLVQNLGVSEGNELGQHAILLGLVEDGVNRTGLYLMEPDGKLSLILKSHTTSELGEIQAVGQSTLGGFNYLHVGLNNKGQFVTNLRYGDRKNAIVLLTPVTP
jgi:hypothetical protein